MSSGFSLTEVLVSLLLVTSSSLALLTQQWHVHQLLNQLSTRVNGLIQLDNRSERLQAGLGLTAMSSLQVQHATFVVE